MTAWERLGGISDPDGRVEWRPQLSSFFITAAVVIAAVAWGVRRSLDAPDGAAWGIVVSVALGIAGIAVFAVMCRCRIVAEGRQVRVRNVLRERAVELGDIRDVVVGHWGLQLQLRDGTNVLALAVSKSNGASLIDARTRGDRVVAELMARVARARDT